MKGLMTKLGLAAAILVAVAAQPNDNLSSFSIAAENKALADLGVVFPDPGNAAVGYLPYLDGSAPSMKTPWFQALNLKNAIAPEDEEGKKAQALALASAGPDLDALLAASRKKDYIMWGLLIKPDPKVTPFSMQLLNFMDLACLAHLMIGDAKIRAAAGDQSAEERMLAAVRIGHHLEEDVTAFGLVWGTIIKEKAAKALSEFYAAKGKKELAEKWSRYSVSMEAKRKTIMEFIKTAAASPRDRIEAVVTNPDYPTSLRIETLVQAHYCTSSREAGLKCRIIGPPAWVKQLEQEAKFQDPQAQAILPLLKNPLSLEELTQMDFINNP